MFRSFRTCLKVVVNSNNTPTLHFPTLGNIILPEILQIPDTCCNLTLNKFCNLLEFRSSLPLELVGICGNSLGISLESVGICWNSEARSFRVLGTCVVGTLWEFSWNCGSCGNFVVGIWATH